VPITPEARQRLAGRMEDRRIELRLRWQDVAEAGGLSLKTLHSVRTGSAGIAPLTERGIDQGLQWESGSVRSIIGGGEPRPAQRGTSKPVSPLAAELLDEPGIERYRPAVNAERDGLAEAREESEDEARIWANPRIPEEDKRILIAYTRLLADRGGRSERQNAGLLRSYSAA